MHGTSDAFRGGRFCLTHPVLDVIFLKVQPFLSIFFLIFLVGAHPHLGDPWIVRWPRSGASTLQLGWFAWPDPLRGQVWDPRLGNLWKDINNQYASYYIWYLRFRFKMKVAMILGILGPRIMQMPFPPGPALWRQLKWLEELWTFARLKRRPVIGQALRGLVVFVSTLGETAVRALLPVRSLLHLQASDQVDHIRQCSKQQNDEKVVGICWKKRSIDASISICSNFSS